MRGGERTAEVWGGRTPFASGGEWPARVDEYLTEEPERWVQSACVLCSNGCGLDIGVRGGRIVGVRGRAQDRVNRGRLGPKGLFGWQANNSPDRLTEPLVRRQGRLQPASWDEAMDLVVENYYTLALVVRGGIGTPHLDGNTRLCTATADFALK